MNLDWQSKLWKFLNIKSKINLNFSLQILSLSLYSLHTLIHTNTISPHAFCHTHQLKVKVYNVHCAHHRHHLSAFRIIWQAILISDFVYFVMKRLHSVKKPHTLYMIFNCRCLSSFVASLLLLFFWLLQLSPIHKIGKRYTRRLFHSKNRQLMVLMWPTWFPD